MLFVYSGMVYSAMGNPTLMILPVEQTVGELIEMHAMMHQCLFVER